MKLQQLGSNQTKIVYNNGDEIFFSYDTPVAGCVSFGYFQTEEKFSRTTSKHIKSYIDGNNSLKISQSEVQALLNNRENGSDKE